MLRGGANISARSTIGETALVMAVATSKLNVVRLLLRFEAQQQASAQRDASDTSRSKCLMGASAKCDVPVVDILVRHLTIDEVWAQDEASATALVYASLAGCVQAVEMLLATSPKPEGFLVDGILLTRTLRLGHGEVAIRLLDAGSPTTREEAGWNAMQWAVANRQWRAARAISPNGFAAGVFVLVLVAMALCAFEFWLVRRRDGAKAGAAKKSRSRPHGAITAERCHRRSKKPSVPADATPEEKKPDPEHAWQCMQQGNVAPELEVAAPPPPEVVEVVRTTLPKARPLPISLAPQTSAEEDVQLAEALAKSAEEHSRRHHAPHTPWWRGQGRGARRNTFDSDNGARGNDSDGDDDSAVAIAYRGPLPARRGESRCVDGSGDCAGSDTDEDSFDDAAPAIHGSLYSTPRTPKSLTTRYSEC